MSREIVWLTWCDGDHEEQVPAEVDHVVAVGSAKPVEVNLCAKCDLFIQGLEAMLAKGTPVEGPSMSRSKASWPSTKNAGADGLPHPCPLCDQISVSEAGLKFHFRKMHDEGTLLQWRLRQAEALDFSRRAG